MTARLYDRLAAAFSLLLMGALALFTFYLAEITQRNQGAKPGGSRASEAPDYFVDRLALSTMNAQGQPALRIQADRLQHQPADDSTTFEAPVLVSLDPSRPRLTAAADTGTLSADGNQAQLRGHVRVTRDATLDQPALLITTDAATVLPDQGIVRTDQPVTIARGSHRLSGVGMELNHPARQLRVDSQVKAVWAPPGPRAVAPPVRSRPDSTLNPAAHTPSP